VPQFVHMARQRSVRIWHVGLLGELDDDVDSRGLCGSKMP
jgi:hypothetical protein